MTPAPLFVILLILFSQLAVASQSSPTTKSAVTNDPSSNSNSYPTANYNLVKDYGAGTSAFFTNFNFFTGADPTNGFVK
jgi:hypothetical protein